MLFCAVWLSVHSDNQPAKHQYRGLHAGWLSQICDENLRFGGNFEWREGERRGEERGGKGRGEGREGERRGEGRGEGREGEVRGERREEGRGEGRETQGGSKAESATPLLCA